MSIVFDRAVSYYDLTRSMPAEIADLPIEVLIRETASTQGLKILEIGVGTGRMAIPMARRVGRLVGADLSLQMMEQLQAKISRTSLKVDLTKADVVRLPFPDGCFDTIYAVHVLHLVNGWRDAVREAKRTLKSGGHFAVNWHRRSPDSPNFILRQELHRLVEGKGVSTRRPGAQSEEEILEELEKWSGEIRIVEVAEWTESSTAGQIIDELDRQLYSETWMIPRALLDESIPHLRQWATLKFGSLERIIEIPYNFRWLLVHKD